MSKRFLQGFTVLLTCAVASIVQCHADQPNSDETIVRTHIPVQVVKSPQGWQLLRDSKPYYINGAGGDGPLEMLAHYGGNSSRVWGVDDQTMARLDEAHQHGITIALGIWLEHERKCFDYDDPHQIEYQKKLVRAAVQKYKDHPAVLVWGIGNEMEGYEAGDNPLIWKHVEDFRP